MIVKLWKVNFQNNTSSYWGDHDSVTVNAPNAKSAIEKAIKHFKGTPHRRLQEIDEVELLAKEEKS